MLASPPGSLLCPFPVLYSWAQGKTGSTVSKWPSLLPLFIAFCSKTLFPPHAFICRENTSFVALPRSSSPCLPPHCTESRHLAILCTEALPLPWGEATCRTAPSLVPCDTQGLGSRSLLHTDGGLQSLSVCILTACIHWPSPPHLSCYQKKLGKYLLSSGPCLSFQFSCLGAACIPAL